MIMGWACATQYFGMENSTSKCSRVFSFHLSAWEGDPPLWYHFQQCYKRQTMLLNT